MIGTSQVMPDEGFPTPHLPFGTVSDGQRSGRGPAGRFTKGNTFSRGNPFSQRLGKFRSAVFEAISEDDVKTLMDRLKKLAASPHGPLALRAIELLLSYTVGRPTLRAEAEEDAAAPPAREVGTIE